MRVTENDSDNSLKQAILAAFTCQQSGNCCRHEGIVYVTPTDIQNMATTLDIDPIIFMQTYVKKKDNQMIIADRHHRPNCFLTTDNCCEVYEARPNACKTYPNWPSIWESNENLLIELSLCPGLKKAYETVINSKKPSDNKN